MSKSFNIEAFKAGQKALTRSGRVATFVGICDECRASNRLVAHLQGYDSVFTYFASGVYPDEDNRYSMYDLVSMVSRHQELIEAWKKGAKIETLVVDGTWHEIVNPMFYEDSDYRIKPEPAVHCLVYDAKSFNNEQTRAVRPKVVKKEDAEANGWRIIKEWEV